MDKGELRTYLRDLAKQVADIAASDENEIIKQRWRDVNALRKPDRAPVWCKPVGCWKEILPPDSFRCEEEPYLGIERVLRRALMKHEIGDDSPVESWWPVSARFDVQPENTYGVDITHAHSGEVGGAWSFSPPIKTEADFDKLRIPTFTYNQAATDERMELIDELFGDILPPRRVASPRFNATVGVQAVNLYGMTEMMLGVAAEPELIHRLVAYVRDVTMASMDAVEQAGLITPNNYGPMYEADPIGEQPADGKYTYKNCWIHGNSQEFDQVSPAMWEEFCLTYQRPIFERFGYSHYGCCESLTHKTAGVASIPNLRIFVCSAWTDLNKILEVCGHDYTIMWRQKATDVVFPDDDETIKRDLYAGAEKLQGRYYQIVLRELQTLVGHMDRLHVWTRYAIEAAEKYA